MERYTTDFIKAAKMHITHFNAINHTAFELIAQDSDKHAGTIIGITGSVQDFSSFDPLKKIKAVLRTYSAVLPIEFPAAPSLHESRETISTQFVIRTELEKKTVQVTPKTGKPYSESALALATQQLEASNRQLEESIRLNTQDGRQAGAVVSLGAGR